MHVLRSRTMVRLSFDLQRNADEWSLVLLVEVHGLVSVLAFALAVEMQRPSASSCVPYVNSGEDSIAPVLSVQELDEFYFKRASSALCFSTSSLVFALGEETRCS